MPLVFRQMARPSKLTPATAHTAEVLARLGYTDEKLASALGVSRSTFSEWKATNAEFADSLKSAKAEADSRVIEALFQRATGYTAPDGSHIPPHPTAIVFWLKNRMPDQFRDTHRTELSGPDGAPIQSAPMVQLSSDQEAALARVISAAQDRVRRIS